MKDTDHAEREPIEPEELVGLLLVAFIMLGVLGPYIFWIAYLTIPGLFDVFVPLSEVTSLN